MAEEESKFFSYLISSPLQNFSNISVYKLWWSIILFTQSTRALHEKDFYIHKMFKTNLKFVNSVLIEISIQVNFIFWFLGTLAEVYFIKILHN